MATLAVSIVNAPSILAQSEGAARTRFEVVSIRPCEPAPDAPGRRSGGLGYTPGKLHGHCLSVGFLVQAAYVMSTGKILGSVQVSGGPAWVNSEQFNIEAEAAGTPSANVIGGPMLQTLLEDRFKLKLHHETKEVSVYNLVVAKNGLKLQALKDGDCTPFDPTRQIDLSKPFSENFAKSCGITGLGKTPSGQWKVNFGGMTLDQIAENLRHVIDRPVINKTGIAGFFNFHIEFAPDENNSAGIKGDGSIGPMLAWSPDDPPGGPSIFSAIQEQAGLRLEAGKGPADSIVIDSVEKPSEN
jgi:uncharacterized protein (TIGR03435 family)